MSIGVGYVLMRSLFGAGWRFGGRRVRFVLVRMSYDDRCFVDDDGGDVVERGVLPAYYHDDAVVHTVELLLSMET
jgi:hypothetical protein